MYKSQKHFLLQCIQAELTPKGVKHELEILEIRTRSI